MSVSSLQANSLVQPLLTTQRLNYAYFLSVVTYKHFGIIWHISLYQYFQISLKWSIQLFVLVKNRNTTLQWKNMNWLYHPRAIQRRKPILLHLCIHVEEKKQMQKKICGEVISWKATVWQAGRRLFSAVVFLHYLCCLFITDRWYEKDTNISK